MKVADTFKTIALSNNMIAAIGNDTKKMYGLQFHPEVSTYGNKHIFIFFTIKLNKLFLC